MKSSTAASTSLKGSLSRIFGVLVPIVIAIFLVLQQANFLVGRSLLIALGDTESTYRRAWFEWDGDVVAKDLVIDPYGLGEEAAIRFESVHVETPGWFWFLRNTFDRKLKRAKLDRIHLTLTGGTSAAGIEPSLGDLGPVGAASASPFEAEGCMQDSVWTREELEQMGLFPQPTRLEFDYRVDGTSLLTTVVLETKGVSRVQLDRKEQLPSPINALLLDQYPAVIQSERWEVQDQGFVSARNRFCAKKDGIDGRRFLERHVESVERLLQTLGLAVDADSRIAYRRFARDGGVFTFGGDYSLGLPSETFYELRDSGEAFTKMSASIEYGGRKIPVQWQRFDPRPLAGLDDGETTFVALQDERAEAIRAGIVAPIAPDAVANTTSVPDATSSVPVPTTDASASAAAATAPATTTSTPAAPAPVTPTPAVTALPAPTTTSVAAPDPVPSTPAPAATVAPSAAAAPEATAPEVPATTTPASTAATGPASVVAAPVTAPVVATPAPAVTRRNLPLQWNDLGKYRGRLIRIWTVHNPPRTVELLSISGDELRVQARLGGGHAEYTIQRSGFLRANLVQ